MQNFDLEQNISGAFAPGREHSFAPQKISCNPFLTAKKVLIAKNEQSERSLLPECGADVLQSGRSMIEMLGVLAIIGVLSVGGIAGYSKAMTKYRINKAIEQITLIAGNVRTFFGPQKDYIGVSCNGHDCNATKGCQGQSGVGSNGNPTYSFNGCPIIKKAKILPDEMIMVTDGKIMSITNPFGGWVNLSGKSKSANGDNQAFRIDYLLGDNMEACIELLSHDWANLGKTIIEVQGVSCGGACPGKSQYFLPPVGIDAAAAICSRSGGIWGIYFYIDVDPSSDYWQEKINPGS